MARRRHTPEQIIRKLAEGHKLLAGGMDVEGVCRQFGIAESTWVALTLDRYSYVVSHLASDAVDKVAALLDGGASA